MPRTYFRGITPVKVSNQKAEVGELNQSAWERKRIGRIETPERTFQRKIIRDYEKTDRR
jgi:hypothetical protein